MDALCCTNDDLLYEPGMQLCDNKLFLSYFEDRLGPLDQRWS